MAGPQRHSRLLALGAIGVAVFAIGVVVALLRLPEWRNVRLPEQSFFAARLQEISAPAGLGLESSPRMQLRSRSIIFDDGSFPQRESAYDVLGPRAADWLTRAGRGPYVEAAARSRWRTWSEAGQLRVLFSVRGVPVSAMWIPDDPLHFPVTATGPPRLKLDRLFLPAVRQASDIELHAMGQPIHLAAVPGSAPPETVLSAPLGGPA
ncbi:MAG TPA: hypothetical protein VNN08_00180, partial [Thermoanaerobaculia bacterium]|nr:hypothetical protein [Thermoanaerobaculia bacterium]